MAHVRQQVIAASAVCLVMVVFLLVLEGALALAKINMRSHSAFLPGMGIAHAPNVYYRHTDEGFSEGYFNSHGFRDYERAYVKPDGVLRILVLGDSYVEALQVPLEKSFTALLEMRMNRNEARTVEVLNLGHSGFGTADAYQRYLNAGVRYDPDVVLLAFLTGNDFRNNSRTLNAGELAFYYELDEAGSLVLDRSLIDAYEQSLTTPKRLWQSFKQKSYLASLVSERLFLLRRSWRREAVEAAMTPASDSGEPVLGELDDLNIYLPEPSARWLEAFEVTRALLKEFNETVRESGRTFVLVTLSNPPQIDPRVQAQLREAYGLPFDFDRPDHIIEEIAADAGIIHLPLMPVFREHRLSGGGVLHGAGDRDSGHWNEAGHELAARSIDAFLRQRELVQPAALQ